MKPNPIIHLRFFALTRLRRRFPPAAAAVIGTVTGAGAVTSAGGGCICDGESDFGCCESDCCCCGASDCCCGVCEGDCGESEAADESEAAGCCGLPGITGCTDGVGGGLI